ncbi:MAG: DHA2 family efflux MFS transporter permease subunit [Acidobacteria bacterium]|nr:DHA2 family efflux MFS transporter permease subunit [Acidobacteriota bacterium]
MDEAAAAAPRRVNPWLVSASVMLGTFMVVLDTTVVNVSLPHIAGNLSASIEETTWALTMYLAANAIILPITGWLANYVGRKRLLLMAISGFTAASVLCGTAPSLPVLIFWRVVQGATGGVMQPLSQAIMLEAFPPRQRGEAMAFFGIGVVVAPILGPVLGGWLTDNLSWRWVFYLNIPFGTAALLLVWRNIHDPAYIRRGSARVDYWGIGLLALAVASLQIGLDQGQKEDWFSSTWITALLSIAAVGLVIFLIHAVRSRAPVVDLRVFRDRTYSAGVVLMTMQSFGLYGSLVLMPVLLQTLMGYPALQAGIAMAPRGLGSLIITPLVGIALAKLTMDPRKIIAVGLGVNALSLFWLAGLDLTAGYWDIFWPQFIQGVGLGMLFVPLATASMDRIPRETMGNATSLFNFMRNIGGSIGIAVVQTVLARDRQAHTNVLGSHVTLYDPSAQQVLENLRAAFVARGSDVVTAASRAQAAVWGMVQKQAGMLAFLDTFVLLGVVFLAMMPLVILMKRPQHHDEAAGGGTAQ